MKLFKSYLEEKMPNRRVIFNEHGFIIYNLVKTECYIEELYVVPEFRQQKIATKLADEVAAIAKEAGCYYLSAQVPVENLDSAQSLRVQLAYGFKLHSANDNVIILTKEI